MNSDMNVKYSSKDISQMLGIEPVTVRKYAHALEKAGYTFLKDPNDRRIFSEKDAMIFRQLQTIRHHSGLSVEKAADVVVAKHYGASESVSLPKKTDHPDGLMQYDERYTFIFEKLQKLEKLDDILRESEDMKKEIKSIQGKMNQQLHEQQKWYVEQLNQQEKKIKDALVEVLNAKEEIAATQKKRWYQFWK